MKQQLKYLSKDEYKTLRELFHITKNLKKQSTYNVRQYYFENKTILVITRIMLA